MSGITFQYTPTAVSGASNTIGMAGVEISGTALKYNFYGGSNITLTQSVSGSSASLYITAQSQSTQPAVGSFNSSSGSIVLVAGSHITLSQSASTITSSAARPIHVSSKPGRRSED